MISSYKANKLIKLILQLKFAPFNFWIKKMPWFFTPRKFICSFTLPNYFLNFLLNYYLYNHYHHSYVNSRNLFFFLLASVLLCSSVSFWNMYQREDHVQSFLTHIIQCISPRNILLTRGNKLFSLLLKICLKRFKRKQLLSFVQAKSSKMLNWVWKKPNLYLSFFLVKKFLFLFVCLLSSKKGWE